MFFSIMFFSTMRFSIMSFSIISFSIMSFSIMSFSILSMSITFFSITTFQFYPLLLCPFQFCPLQFHRFQFCPFKFCLFQFYPLKFCSFQFYPFQFCNFQSLWLTGSPSAARLGLCQLPMMRCLLCSSVYVSTKSLQCFDSHCWGRSLAICLDGHFGIYVFSWLYDRLSKHNGGERAYGKRHAKWTIEWAPSLAWISENEGIRKQGIYGWLERWSRLWSRDMQVAMKSMVTNGMDRYARTN